MSEAKHAKDTPRDEVTRSTEQIVYAALAEAAEAAWSLAELAASRAKPGEDGAPGVARRVTDEGAPGASSGGSASGVTAERRGACDSTRRDVEAGATVARSAPGVTEEGTRNATEGAPSGARGRRRRRQDGDGAL
jgi:hypothetical protein